MYAASFDNTSVQLYLPHLIYISVFLSKTDLFHVFGFLQISTASGQNGSSGPKTPTSISRHKSEKEKKLGHRRVGQGGEITYKKVR